MISINKKVVGELEKMLDEKMANWSRQVKIKDGWVCTHPGCGEIDRQLLESHHTRPRRSFPELMYKVDNGECLCMFHHAERHRDNTVIKNQILARLGDILYLRLNRHLIKNPCKSMGPPEGLLR